MSLLAHHSESTVVMPESLYKLNRSSFTVTVHWVNVRQAEVVLRQLRATLAELDQILLHDKRVLTERTRRSSKPALIFQTQYFSTIRVFPFIASPRIAMLGPKRMDDLLRKRTTLRLKVEQEIRAIEAWLRRSET